MSIINGPDIEYTDYKCSTRHIVIQILRRFISCAIEVKYKVLEFEPQLRMLIDMSMQGQTTLITTSIKDTIAAVREKQYHAHKFEERLLGLLIQLSKNSDYETKRVIYHMLAQKDTRDFFSTKFLGIKKRYDEGGGQAKKKKVVDEDKDSQALTTNSETFTG